MPNYLVKFHLSNGSILERNISKDTINDVKVEAMVNLFQSDEYALIITAGNLVATEIILEKSTNNNYDETDDYVYSD